jgi:hypothetical protein
MNALLSRTGDDRDPPLTDDEAKLLGDVYARLHLLVPSFRDSDELLEIGRAVYAGAGNARRVLRRAGFGKLQVFLARTIAALRETGYFADAGIVRQFSALIRQWDTTPSGDDAPVGHGIHD